MSQSFINTNKIRTKNYQNKQIKECLKQSLQDAKYKHECSDQDLRLDDTLRKQFSDI